MIRASLEQKAEDSPPRDKRLLLFGLLLLLSGCDVGPKRTYAVDHKNGTRHCVVASSFSYGGGGCYSFTDNGYAIAALCEVTAVVAVEKCEEKR